MTGFLDKLLKNVLHLAHNLELGTEHTKHWHQSWMACRLSPAPSLFELGNYHTKEEALPKAWQKKVFCGVGFYTDHDFPTAVLKKRVKYAKDKRVLNEKHIQCQHRTLQRCRSSMMMALSYTGMLQKWQGIWLHKDFQLMWWSRPLTWIKRAFSFCLPSSVAGAETGTAGSSIQRSNHAQIQDKLRGFSRQSPIRLKVQCYFIHADKTYFITKWYSLAIHS